MMALSVTKFMLLAVTVLAVHRAEGRLVSKCELKNELEAAFQLNQSFGNQSFGNQSFGNQTLGNQSTLDVVAKIVCKVQLTSGFNTSLVTQLAPATAGTKKPGYDNSNHKNQPPKRRARDTRRQQSEGKNKGEKQYGSSESEEDNHGNHGNVTPPTPTVSLYGLFQLSGSVACSDGVNPSSNICNIPCSALTDGNIYDDVACYKRITGSSLKQPEGLPQQCAGVVYSTYFSECL
ncbi:uncharacterized protein LOC108926291 [Scleropages formosus]|uniref:uncharacterized protein LOC108926291 n=1 Tax=Scleropages formosus TaxID=113540 RepID=UPI0008781E93|nr:uncharacterized protein LOC108926291 [Scleropages formosus]